MPSHSSCALHASLLDDHPHWSQAGRKLVCDDKHLVLVALACACVCVCACVWCCSTAALRQSAEITWRVKFNGWRGSRAGPPPLLCCRDCQSTNCRCDCSCAPRLTAFLCPRSARTGGVGATRCGRCDCSLDSMAPREHRPHNESTADKRCHRHASKQDRAAARENSFKCKRV